jgi:hypothetical protein
MKQTCLFKSKDTDESSSCRTGELTLQNGTGYPIEFLSDYSLSNPIVIAQNQNFVWMKKIAITFLIAFCLSSISYAQDYRTGIGLRAGFSNGLTIKHFIGNTTALEGIFASRWRGLEFTGLYEFENQFFNAQRLNWYVGFGGHVGLWNGDYVKWGTSGTQYVVIGIDGILGIEYNFREIPFNIGLDWKPAFNFYGYTGFWTDGGAISFRFIF